MFVTKKANGSRVIKGAGYFELLADGSMRIVGADGHAKPFHFRLWSGDTLEIRTENGSLYRLDLTFKEND